MTIKMDDIIKVEKLHKCFKISWKMTDACNYRCPYCYMKDAVAKQNHTPQDFVEKIASRIDRLIEVQSKGRSVNLHLIGGEICLYDLVPVIDKIKSKQLKSIILATNFSAKDDYWQRLTDYLRQRNVTPNIISSFHLSQCDKNEFVRKAIKFNTHVKAVVNSENLDTYRPYFDELLDNGNCVEVTVERDDQNKCVPLTEEQQCYIDFLNKELLKHQTYFNVYLKNGDVITFPSNISFIDSIDIGGFDPDGWVCTAGIDGIRINQKGDVQRAGCRHSSINKIGNIFDDNIYDKLPKHNFICRTKETDSKGVFKHKFCTCFGNSSMWRGEEDD